MKSAPSHGRHDVGLRLTDLLVFLTPAVLMLVTGIFVNVFFERPAPTRLATVAPTTSSASLFQPNLSLPAGFSLSGRPCRIAIGRI